MNQTQKLKQIPDAFRPGKRRSRTRPTDYVYVEEVSVECRERCSGMGISQKGFLPALFFPVEGGGGGSAAFSASVRPTKVTAFQIAFFFAREEKRKFPLSRLFFRKEMRKQDGFSFQKRESSGRQPELEAHRRRPYGKKVFPPTFPVFSFAGVVDASVAFLFLFFSAKKLGFFFSCLFFFAAWFSFEFCGALLCRAVSNFHARRMILSETSPEPLCLTL